MLEPEEAARQHERLIMDSDLAYKIPPLNIINKKNEHIVGINGREAWRGSTASGQRLQNSRILSHFGYQDKFLYL